MMYRSWYIYPNIEKSSSCKWILNKKCKSHGSINKYKVRLVAKDFTQKPSIDYEETYSIVAKFILIGILLSIVVAFDLKLFQMDFKITFLNGELKTKIHAITLML